MNLNIATLLGALVACLFPTAILADDATHFFQTHPNTIDIREDDGRILFANRQVGLDLPPSTNGFFLQRLYGIELKQDFLAEQASSDAKSLFEIVMTLDPMHVGKDERWNTRMGLLGIMHEMAGESFTIDPSTARTVTWHQETHPGESSLHLQWNGIDVQEDEAVLDVEVTITLRAGDPLSYWRIGIRNRSGRYGIERVYFPQVELAPIGRPADNTLVFPRGRGAVVEDPFDRPQGFLVNGYYTLHFNMQFQALYNRVNGNGIFLGTRDSTPNFSKVEIVKGPKHLKWRLGHFPPNIAFSKEDFSLTYDCVVGPFTGDWFDACQMYRQWALAQTWCRQGPLASRPDIPEWFKTAPLHFFADIGAFAEGAHALKDNLTITADHLLEFIDWAGMPLPATVYGWKQYHRGMTTYDVPINRLRAKNQGKYAGTPCENAHEGNYPKIPALPGFADMCHRLRNAGGMVTPYVALELFDQGAAENAPYAAEAKSHITRDLYGALRTWGAERTWQPCAWTAWWRQRLQETAVHLVQDEHVGGLYLDVMQGSALPCYWTPHGHSAAGASAMTVGMHQLSRGIRDAAKNVDPEAITTGENATENMIDVIDGILQSALQPENKAPLFAAVYQDYIPRYGLGVSVGVGWRDRYIHVTDDDAFSLECASLFVEGLQMGRIRLRPRDTCLSFQNPDHKPLIAFLDQLVGYYRHPSTRNFLAYGQLMRPLEFDGPSSMPVLTISTGGQYRHAGTFTALLSGVFRSDRGELGVFIVNASTKDLRFQADLELSEYGLDPEMTVDVDKITPAGLTKPFYHQARATVVLTGKLAARNATMFHVKPHWSD